MPRHLYCVYGRSDFAIPALQKLAETQNICAVYTQPAKPAERGMKSTPVPVAAYAADKSLALFSPASLKTDYAQQNLPRMTLIYLLLLPMGCYCQRLF